MNTLLRLRLVVAALFVLLLGGCASTDTIRGKLNYDLRPEGSRADVVWPPAPEIPRYRYVGELVGQSNFLHDKTTDDKFVTVLKWIVGLFDDESAVLLHLPQNGTVGDSGRVYVADSGRNAVMVFDPNPPADDDSEAKEGQFLVWNRATAGRRFESPVAVALVWNGELAVSDSRLGVVTRLNAKGEPVGLLAMDALKRPTGLAFAPERGWLFVADTAAHDIKVFDGTGSLVKTIGKPGEGEGEFNAPTHLTYSEGMLYVSDTLSSRIQIFDLDGKHVGGFGERGEYVGNLVRPKGVAIGDGGIIYVVESYFGRLLAFNKQKEFLLDISGSGLKGREFRLPAGVWTDKHGLIYVADMHNSRVVVYKFVSPGG
jgi:sugar lactone lactonase YvrE